MPHNLIIRKYCELTGLTMQELTAVTRDPKIWYANYMLWSYIHCEMKVSIGKMCKIFNRTRPTLFRGIRILRQQMFYHKDIKDRYEDIKKELEGMTEAAPSENME